MLIFPFEEPMNRRDRYPEPCKFLEENKVIDIEDPNIKELEFLGDIQGNILKIHGRDYSVYLFLKFKENEKEKLKIWIANFARKLVVSALKQQVQTLCRKIKISLLGPLAILNAKTIALSLRQLMNLRKWDTPEGMDSKHEKIFVNFFLSYSGYKHLVGEKDINSLKIVTDIFFQKGMAHVGKFDEEGRNNLKDEIEHFEEEYKDKIDALIVLADDDHNILWEETKKILEDIKDKSIQVIKKEVGFVRRNSRDKTIEPFGFADGISQPLFLKKDIDKIKENEGICNWEPSANLGLVVQIDPLGKLGPVKGKDEKKRTYGYGSVLVYRKLEQNVEGFNQEVKKLACQLEGQENNCRPKQETEELVRAFIMGRWPDGRPIAVHGPNDHEDESKKAREYPFWENVLCKLMTILRFQSTRESLLCQKSILPKIINNFNYGTGNDFHNNSDFKCPFHTHIRKMNPRGIEKGDIVAAGPYTNGPAAQRKLRIVRRGVTYGLPNNKQKSLLSPSTKGKLEGYKELCKNLDICFKEGEEGILFLSFQSSIKNQFFVLQEYANLQNLGPNNRQEKSDIELVDIGLDPIIGQGKDKTISQRWSKEWNKEEQLDFHFSGYVIPRGGEYFFAPSLSFLRSLKEE
ncbi:MAG: hypothetical protein F6K10_12590 [Moorea sp. SIO2B7]|nr:hypothetical protein [Moorena sp. SIO2B7]